MPLFRLESGKASVVNTTTLPNEAALQKLIDENLETITGVRILESQYPIPNGRIDTLGIDERNVPVVIEYKWGQDPGAIIQSLFYLDWLRNNRRTFEMLTREKLGSKVLVNWSAPQRVIVIAKDFDPKELSAVNQMSPVVELKKYSFYGNLLAVDDSTPIRLLKQTPTKEVPQEDFDATQPSLESVLKPALPEVKETFWKLRDMILGLGEDVREVPGKWWVDYRKSTTFVSPNIQKKRLVIYVKMGDLSINDPKGITSRVTWYGRLNTRFFLISTNDLEYAMNLIKQGYDNVP